MPDPARKLQRTYPPPASERVRGSKITLLVGKWDKLQCKPKTQSGRNGYFRVAARLGASGEHKTLGLLQSKGSEQGNKTLGERGGTTIEPIKKTRLLSSERPTRF